MSEALILASHGEQGYARLQDSGHTVLVRYRRSVGRPLCGDRVEISQSGDEQVVSRILPRRNAFARADARGRKQTIAANLDRVLVVVAPRPAPSTDLLERYLVAVHSLGIEPVIILNKVDLLAEEPEAEASTLPHFDEYRDLGYTTVRTSCKAPPGIDELQQLLSGQTSILVGQSGVGKSSLVNRLLPDLDLQTGELSRATGKGTHTTTTTIMYTLPCGGHLIDSPGVWEYGLWSMEGREIAAGFRDIEACIGQCRFNDCLHAGEPGCAVAAAVERGEIRMWRYESYRRLLQQSL